MKHWILESLRLRKQSCRLSNLMTSNKICFKKIESGQGFLEYAVILALLVLISVFGARAIGNKSADNLSKLLPAFNQTSTDSPGGSGGQLPENVLLTSDEFDNLDDWKKINGPNCWKTVGGILQVTKGKCTSVLLNQTTLPDDYLVNMSMAQLLSGEGYGLMFRLNKEKESFTGYSFQVDSGYGNQFVFRRYDKNGTELGEPLATASFPAGFDVNAAHDVSVSVVGDTYIAYVDGVQVLTAVDDTYSSGGTGLRTWGESQSQFDGFSVSTP